VSDEYPDKKLIIKVYEALGNYLQIAVGFGAFQTHSFSIENFCKIFKFPIIQTRNALKILESADYIEYIEEPDASSRLLFLINRDEMYKTKLDKLSDNIIQVILRSYTGPFADYIFIDETLIATRVGATNDAVYNALILLSKSHIISYIPQKKLPQIKFARNREEAKRVAIPRSSFEERYERTQLRISNVIEYIKEQDICRTRMLLRYFGEKTDKDCRMCDICLRKNQAGIRTWEFNSVREALMKYLKDNNSASIQFLSNELPLDKDKNIKVIRFLLNYEEKLKYKDGIISIEN
jgi:ATP-dependent DNA helicase RecQ